ncbi:MAG: adenylate/guanylate cyclase domain-containing protein [Treponema sp.]|nr:adenylate/guanylate cyclase domain-containing protein [Treponema sp.]
MPISIEFQIAGLVFTIILAFAFFKKVKWDSLQNRIYKVLILLVLVLLSLDIASVISIDNRDEYPIINAILSKAYLIVMLYYIYCIDVYAISCTMSNKLPEYRKKIKQGVIVFLGIATLVITGLICINTLYYNGYGRKLYSYGFPSDLIYIFSTFSVAFVIFIMMLNFRNIQLSKMFSILSFCIMEGIIAIAQLFNKELLLVGFGCSATLFIMYFTVENPDAQTISRLSHANKRARELLKFYTTMSGSRKNIDTSSSTTSLFPNVCVMVLDVVDFSKFSNRMGIERLAKYLSSLFEKIESASDSFRVEKLRSFGSFYMAVSGVNSENDASATEMVHFAIEILNILKKTNTQSGMNLQLRIGIASGPIVVDLMGNQNFIFNAWGQPMALADALHKNCLPNTINVSESVYSQLKELYDFEAAPETELEGVGKIRSWQLEPLGGAV